MKYFTFETDRLYIRPTSTEDASFIVTLMNTPKWIQFIGDRKVHTIDDAVAYINTKMTPQLEELGYANYTVITKEGNHKIGTCGLYNREGLEGIDIGFAFLPDHEGQGFAFEASNRIKQAAFEDFDIDMIKAITTKDNISSQKLLEKLGLTLTGTTSLLNDEEELLVYMIKK